MDKWFYRISVAFVIIGLLVSIYMTIYKLTGDNGMCLGSGDCSTVNASRYAVVNGIPVAVLGIVGYAAILAAYYLETRRGYFMQNGTLLIFGMALTGFLFTLWLVYVEIVLIKALCPFCVTSQVSMTIIFILSVIRLIRQPNLRRSEMPRIKCHYADCVFLDDGYCSAAAVELDPDAGCNTYSPSEEAVKEDDWEDEEELEEWEDDDAEEEDEEWLDDEDEF